MDKPVRMYTKRVARGSLGTSRKPNERKGFQMPAVLRGVRLVELINAIAVTIVWVSVLSLFTWAGTRIYMNVQYHYAVGSHMLAVSKAGTVETAVQQVEAIITGAESKGWTAGNTSIFTPTDNNSLTIWYQDMRQLLAGLKAVPTDNAEARSLAMINTRPVMSGGDMTNAPSGISIYPYNKLYAAWAFGSLVVGVLALLVFSWVSDSLYAQRHGWYR